ncbi:hypothetical protein IDSA_07120 [Pseudidiomarina salinarum]|uniref:Uncharacterized protein n=1 Tax=Pseudidiomarina salinarum TaxID=435908 RepID=A0A094JE88_9GAMM|nr:hypothetical protein IDSA_07120 [Pseudidiomarina salinarum]RUO71318.1 hypothetical protein CWI79_07800 [Pseudidiomarina salinarum]
MLRALAIESQVFKQALILGRAPPRKIGAVISRRFHQNKSKDFYTQIKIHKSNQRYAMGQINYATTVLLLLMQYGDDLNIMRFNILPISMTTERCE